MQHGHWQRYKQEYYINISLHDFQPYQTLLPLIWKQILLARIGMKHACKNILISNNFKNILVIHMVGLHTFSHALLTILVTTISTSLYRRHQISAI